MLKAELARRVRARAVTVAVLAASTFGVNCSADATHSFVILKGAVNIRSEAGFGVDGVEYDVPGREANQVVLQIAHELERQGWKPLAQLWDHRDESSTSFVNGWMCYPSPPQGERPTIRFQWIADWQAVNGDVVTYIVGCAAAPPDCEQVEVAASFTCADLITDGASNVFVDSSPNLNISDQCSALRRELQHRQDKF